MKFTIRLMILGLGLVNGMTTGSADVLVGDGQVILASDISDISIDPNTGDISVSINAGITYTITREDGGGGGPQVVINTMTASQSPILEGENVTISWTTTDADSCTTADGGGGWAGENIPVGDLASGQRTVTLATAGTYSFRLNCSNDTPSSTFATEIVVVEEDVVVAGDVCPEDFVAPLAGDIVPWSAVTSYSWPDPHYKETPIGIDRRGYMAIEFNTGDFAGIDGAIRTLTYAGTEGSRFGAISECPGDFSQHLPDTAFKCVQNWFIGGTLNWSTETNPASYECKLETGTTYYVNITFTDGENESADTCTSNFFDCRTIFLSAY